MKTPEYAFVALGSNLGDRHAHLAEARRQLGLLPGSRVIAASAIEETEPIGPAAQGRYLNQMVLLLTALSPDALLAQCLAIEYLAGRVRRERWGPRTLDLDIVRFGDGRIDQPNLRVPHPELPHRPFWQRELEELAPHAR